MAPYIALILVVAAVFGICFLLDKGFTKLFRGKIQHKSGMSVRLNKRFGSFGLLVAVLGIAGIFGGISGGWLLLVGGCLLVLVGVGLVVYYLSLGIYYDADSFIYSAFGKKSMTYRYSDIQGQQLYVTNSGVVVELHMIDGNAILLQPSMTGIDQFIAKASDSWFAQTGKTKEECEFYKPEESCWFPPV